MKKYKKCKCRNCRDIFIPDYRNTNRHKFSHKPECRKASKKYSQRKWLKKPENRDYFRGPENVERVRQWRKDHPGYWRKNQVALQDSLQENMIQNQVDKIHIDTGSTALSPALQDDIEMTLRRMQKLGMDILHHSISNKGGQHVCWFSVKRTNPTEAIQF